MFCLLLLDAVSKFSNLLTYLLTQNEGAFQSFTKCSKLQQSHRLIAICPLTTTGRITK